MKPAAPRTWAVLTRDACADAVRRRVVPAIVVTSLLSLLAVDSCTSCSTDIVVSGQQLAAERLAGWSSALVFAVLGLWTLVLAGVLAAGHLSDCLDDGSAALILSRPVSRPVYVLARLSGALAVALATGALLLGGAGLLIRARLGVDLGPALDAGLACAAGSVVVGALAMVASLFMPQIASVLLVVLGVGGVAAANLLSQLGRDSGGFLGAVDGYGPPLYSALAVGLAPWFGAEAAPGAALAVGVRLALWLAVALLALIVVFQTEELR